MSVAKSKQSQRRSRNSEANEAAPRSSRGSNLLKKRPEAVKLIIDGKDVTPKRMDSKNVDKDFQKIENQIEEFLSLREKRYDVLDPDLRRTSLGKMIRVTIDDVVEKLTKGLFVLDEFTREEVRRRSTDSNRIEVQEQKFSPFIKVDLRQSEDILLYEQRSHTVPAGSHEATKVEKENKDYEYATKGKGKYTRKADSDAQTTCVLYKSRESNTDTIKTANEASYVSNYELFDTYRQLNLVQSSIKLDDAKTLDITTYKVGGVDPCEQIGRSPQFNLAQMITQRVLAGNVFKNQQRRFRNMFMPDPLAPQVEYLYRCEVLFLLFPKHIMKERTAVSCMSWCPANGDILAVGYGVFTCTPNYSRKAGLVCIWNIKNPVSPEKYYRYTSTVESVQFSQFRPQLLAVGLFNGNVEVRDITTSTDTIVAMSLRDTSPGYQSVNEIKWIPLDAGETGIEPFLTVSQDGLVMKYRILNSPYLYGYIHAVLSRVEGSPEGLLVQRSTDALDASRRPQLMGITLDPLIEDIFYVFSNEGVMYKCSTNFPQQHLSLLQVHEAPVYAMSFSPWSPKIFLTSGEDWYIRIWIDGVFKPVITLLNTFAPVNSACWSKTHSTIIMSMNRTSFDIWDIRRNTLKPMSSKRFERSYQTMLQLSNCGRSVAAGNEKGAVFVCALEDMPFIPHFQYEELEKAIYNSLQPFPDLFDEVKNLGYLGYPKKKHSYY